jgi:hypothetical protein
MSLAEAGKASSLLNVYKIFGTIIPLIGPKNRLLTQLEWHCKALPVQHTDYGHECMKKMRELNEIYIIDKNKNPTSSI